MGSAGWSYGLRPRGGCEQARLKQVREEILDVLLDVWRKDLGSSFAMARGWTAYGEDSLLWLGMPGPAADRWVPDRLTFWFSERVEWPMDLARHWLEVALAFRRGRFEQALAKLGFEVDAERWPTVRAAIAHCECEYCRLVRNGAEPASQRPALGR